MCNIPQQQFGFAKVDGTVGQLEKRETCQTQNENLRTIDLQFGDTSSCANGKIEYSMSSPV